MLTIPKLLELSKRERERIVYENVGFLTRVAEQTGYSLASVSRVFHRRTDPVRSPVVAQALEDAISKVQSGDSFRRKRDAA